jgi:hypothetical protein
MLELLRELQNRGWPLANPDDRFLVLADDTVHWQLVHLDSHRQSEVEFKLMHGLGQPTSDLRDLSDIRVQGYDKEFLIPKIGTVRWEAAMKEIVETVEGARPD